MTKLKREVKKNAFKINTNLLLILTGFLTTPAAIAFAVQAQSGSYYTGMDHWMVDLAADPSCVVNGSARGLNKTLHR